MCSRKVRDMLEIILFVFNIQCNGKYCYFGFNVIDLNIKQLHFIPSF